MSGLQIPASDDPRRGSVLRLARTLQTCRARGKQVRGRAAREIVRGLAETPPRRCGMRLSRPSHSVGAQRTFHDDVAA